MTVAILDLTPKGVPAIVSGAVSDIMRSEFSNFANFIVVERNQIREVLKEQGFQMTGCTPWIITATARSIILCYIGRDMERSI